MSRFNTALGTLCLIAWTITTSATPLVDTVQLVSGSAVSAAAVPATQTFSISQAGSYTVTLTDLQLPVALASLNLAIVNSTSAVTTLTAPGTQKVTLAAGTYTAQVLATAASGAVGGTFSIQVTPANGGGWVLSDGGGPGEATSRAVRQGEPRVLPERKDETRVGKASFNRHGARSSNL